MSGIYQKQKLLMGGIEMSKFELTGKVALITSGSYGIGFAIAKAYAKAEQPLYLMILNRN